MRLGGGGGGAGGAGWGVMERVLGMATRPLSVVLKTTLPEQSWRMRCLSLFLGWGGGAGFGAFGGSARSLAKCNETERRVIDSRGRGVTVGGGWGKGGLVAVR